MEVKTEFDRIMEYAPDNRAAFKALLEAVKKKTVVPFVGAGLSAEVYPQWKDALRELASKLIDDDLKKTVNDKIDAGNYDEAAEIIVSNRPPIVFYRDLLELFNEKKLEDRELSGMAAYLLPFIFPESPVLTVNFDRLLEHVYLENDRPFERNVYTPSDYSALKAAQRALHFIFKLHGDIGTKDLNERDIVFTKESYDRHYAEGGELVSTLRSFFAAKQMLFLGCSLKYDRTFEVFKKVCGGTELEHFAILPSEKAKLGENLNLFGSARILPIFYDPDNGIKHCAVKVILDELLRSVDTAAHADYESRLPAARDITDNPFLYTTRASAFAGRDDELKELRAFAADPAHFRWWAVLGPGGMGKSRLSLELELELKKSGWHVERLKEGDYANLSGLRDMLEAHNDILVIADYGQGHAKELGKWMSGLINRKTGRLRILILERDAAASSEQLTDRLACAGEGIREKLWEEPMRLWPMEPGDLIEIMRSYAEYRGKKLADDKLKGLLSTLAEVDRGLVRPLYALFITDAVCEGEDPTHWKRERVLDWVLGREERLLNRNLGKETGTDIINEQAKAIRMLRVIATFCGDIGIERLKRDYSEAWNYYAESFDKSPGYPGLADRLNGSGVAERGKLLALRPDLMGEYLVLKDLDNALPHLFRPGWAEDGGKQEFLFRLILDYHDDLAGNAEFFDRVFDASPAELELCRGYCRTLVNISGYFAAQASRAAERLRALSEERFPDDREIAHTYAMGLVNLSNAQNDPVVCSETLERLRALSEERFKDDREITLQYARGLYNLSNAQNDLTKRAATLKKLRALSEKRFPGDREIAHTYAMGLFNLSNRQNDLTERAATLDLLRALSEERFPDDREIALEYAKGLLNLSNAQNDLAERSKTIDKLRALSEDRFPDDREIAHQYAMGLFNLSCRQNDPAERSETVEKLRALSEDRFKGDREIALEYAKGLVVQGLDDHSVASANEGRLLAMPGEVIAAIKQFFVERTPPENMPLFFVIYPRLFSDLIPEDMRDIIEEFRAMLGLSPLAPEDD